MKGIFKLGMVITKILEVFHWVGSALMLGAVVSSVAKPDFVKYFVEFDAKECCGTNLEVYGFEVNAPVVDGQTDMTAFTLFGIGAVIVLALMAMVFRNLNLIFKHSDKSPFNKDNARMMKEIGIFAIAIPIVEFIISIVIRLVLGAESAEISINTGGILMGIIVLCLTQYFVHGADLENDVDGLL